MSNMERMIVSKSGTRGTGYLWSKEVFRPGDWAKLGREREGEGSEDEEGKNKVDSLAYICTSNSTPTSRFPFEMWLKCVRRDENSGKDLPKSRRQGQLKGTSSKLKHHKKSWLRYQFSKMIRYLQSARLGKNTANKSSSGCLKERRTYGDLSYPGLTDTTDYSPAGSPVNQLVIV